MNSKEVLDSLVLLAGISLGILLWALSTPIIQQSFKKYLFIWKQTN